MVPFLTVYSYEKTPTKRRKADSSNTASDEDLRQRLEGKVSAENLRILLRYRKNKKFENLGQLLTGEGIDKTEKEKAETEGEGESTDSSRDGRSEPEQVATPKPPGGEGEGSQEPSVASETIADTTHEGAIFTFDEFKLAVDELTLEEEESIPGRVNINTAPQEVLASLPGMTSQPRRTYRRAEIVRPGAFESIADLAAVEAMSSRNLHEPLALCLRPVDCIRGLGGWILAQQPGIASGRGVCRPRSQGFEDPLLSRNQMIGRKRSEAASAWARRERNGWLGG
jgi:DNA uptake protein ComE-like DNA-binding protein